MLPFEDSVSISSEEVVLEELSLVDSLSEDTFSPSKVVASSLEVSVPLLDVVLSSSRLLTSSKFFSRVLIV